MPQGGFRLNSGRKRGFKFQYNLAKIEARELVRKVVTANLGPLLQAQIANATGIKYLVARDPRSGTFKRLTEAEIEALGTEGSTVPDTVEIWAKDPNVTAALGLLAYAIDKPKEQAQQIEVTGSVDVVQVLKQRSAKRLAPVTIDVKPERSEPE